MDGSCARCGQNIPAWLTFTLGRGGRVYCSEYCQRLDEQSREAPEPEFSDGNGSTGNGWSGARDAASAHPADDRSKGTGGEASGEGSGERKRLRFLSRLR